MSAMTKTKPDLKRHAFALTCGALLLALGILLPQMFHMALGQAAGQTFLPMHISVLLAGCFLGWKYGLLVGAVTPLLSFLLTGMPPVPMVFLMVAELGFYGLASGVFNKLLRSREKGSLPRIALAVLIAQVCGRAAYAAVLLLFGTLLGLKGVPGPAMVLTALTMGWPGILIQLAAVPALVRVLHMLKLGTQI